MTKQSDGTFNATVKELAEHWGVDYIVAASVIKLLATQGTVKEVGKEKLPEGQRGKPSTIFNLPAVVEFVTWQEETPEEENKTENPDDVDVTENVPAGDIITSVG